MVEYSVLGSDIVWFGFVGLDVVRVELDAGFRMLGLWINCYRVIEDWKGEYSGGCEDEGAGVGRRGLE